MDQDDLKERLAAAVDSNDRYRSRARAVATLCAAAAGALAVGLILAPGEAVPKPAQVLGLVAVTLLIAGTALSVAASSASSYESEENQPAKFLRRIEAWRIRTESAQSEGQPPTYEALIEDARRVKGGIARLQSWGLWAATLAAMALVVSLALATFMAEASSVVTIEFNADLALSHCPDIESTVRGEVLDRELASSADILPVRVTADDCGNSVGATLYLDRTLVAVVGSRT